MTAQASREQASHPNKPSNPRSERSPRSGAVSRPNYGIDAPGIAARLTIVGIGCAAGALAFRIDALAWPGATLIAPWCCSATLLPTIRKVRRYTTLCSAVERNESEFSRSKTRRW